MKRYFNNIWLGLYTALVGMKITFSHMFQAKVTVQYPNERYPIPDNARNRLILEPELCNGCTSCARACPVNCITIETLRVVPDDPDQPMIADGTKRKLWVPQYDIDFAKCCFCSLCTVVCPTLAVRHTVEFEYSTLNREDMYYRFSDMSPEVVANKRQMLADFQEKEKAAKEAAAARKAEEEKAKAEADKAQADVAGTAKAE